MALDIVLLVVGFALLIKGADFFVEGASKIAERFRIPQIIIGLTVVAFGTSLPEAGVSVSATLKQSGDMAIGNVVGSNILNVLLILGVTACIVPLSVKRNTIRFEIPFVMLITSIMTAIGYFTGQLNFVAGIILWALFIGFFVYLFHSAKAEMSQNREKDLIAAEEARKQSIWKLLAFTLLGLGAVILGSNITVDSATAIAQVLKVDERIIGLTIVAFGTSLPELVTSIMAAIKGKADIAVGNVIGSNIFNILFILGTSALLAPLTYSRGFVVDGLICIASTVLLFVCVVRKGKIARWSGAVFLLSYGAYFTYLLLS